MTMNYTIKLSTGTETTLEADGYARSKNGALLVFNDSAKVPIGNFPASSGIYETERGTGD